MLNSAYIRYGGVAASALIILAASILLLSSREDETAVYTRPAMGTVVELRLMEGDRVRFDEAARAAFKEIERLEALFSSYRPDSDISRVNRNAGKGALGVSTEVFEVTKEAVRVARLSGGAFDPTIGALGRAWGPSGEKGTVPSKGEMEELLPLVDYSGVIIDENARKVGLARAGMALNLGGVAKGFIAGEAVRTLKANGVTRGVVHAGGDMVVFQEGRQKPFTIGVQHPREKRLLGEAYIHSGAVPTSGDYERYFEKDGVRYHHILDPRTGFPARGVQSVTLAADDPTTADALATAVFVMGPERGMELIERLDGVEGVIVDDKGAVKTSGGFQGKIY